VWKSVLVLCVSLTWMELLERCSPGMYPIRSLSVAILEVVANPRAVMVPVDTSLLENMPWSEM
jgi:hypothetical protein